MWKKVSHHNDLILNNILNKLKLKQNNNKKIYFLKGLISFYFS